MVVEVCEYDVNYLVLLYVMLCLINYEMGEIKF